MLGPHNIAKELDYGLFPKKKFEIKNLHNVHLYAPHD